MIGLLLAAALVAGGPATSAAPQPAPRVVSLATLLAEAQRGDLAAATIDDRRQRVTGRLLRGGTLSATYPPGFAPDLTVRLLAAKVDVTAATATGHGSSPWASFAGYAVAAAMLLLTLAVVVRGRRTPSQGDSGHAASTAQLGKGRGEPVKVPDTRFHDVAGVDEAVEDLRELVRFLHRPERFTRTGARLPRGYLLIGPPGTGKTLLARAVAGEAGVPFYAMSGSEFVELYVGVGASRIRTLFDRARQSGKALVFIDEIDAIGRARSSGPASSANDERESTLNQLLVEMDGFVPASSVVVIAATNRPDVLDQALLRPGRFDRRVVVAAPDRRGRHRILELHARRRPLAADVDLEALARRTAGFTGADLANLVNQAALVAVRDAAAAVTQAHVNEALSTIMLGPARRSLEVAERDRVITAWHEAGHALAGLLVPEADDPVQVSIVPRGAAGGTTWFSAGDELLMTVRQARARLLVALAGRAAEELHLGDDFTQGAADDFRSATEVARRMATEFGMSTLGPRHITPEEFQLGPMAADVHAATHALLDEAIAAARALLLAHREALLAVVDLLLAEETVDLAALRHAVDVRIAGVEVEG